MQNFKTEFSEMWLIIMNMESHFIFQVSYDEFHKVNSIEVHSFIVGVSLRRLLLEVFIITCKLHVYICNELLNNLDFLFPRAWGRWTAYPLSFLPGTGFLLEWFYPTVLFLNVTSSESFSVVNFLWPVYFPCFPVASYFKWCHFLTHLFVHYPHLGCVSQRGSYVAAK